MKLQHKLGDADLAAELVAIGLDSPKKIKAEKSLSKRIGRRKAAKVRKKVK